MALRLSAVARKFATNEAAVRAELVHPVLVWEIYDAPEDSDGPLTEVVPDLEGALKGRAADAAFAGDASLVFVLDGEAKTVGRIPQNDVVLPDKSVSRVHAYLQRDPQTRAWTLVDKGSSNGTWVGARVGATRLRSNEPYALQDRLRVSFGTVELFYLSPESFFDYVQRLLPHLRTEGPYEIEEEEVSLPPQQPPPRPASDRFDAQLSIGELDALLDFYRLSMKALDGLAVRAAGDPNVEKARQRSEDANRVLRKLVTASKKGP